MDDGEIANYLSGDTEYLDHNMSLISCKLVHTFFFRPDLTIWKLKPITSAGIQNT